MFSGLVLDLLVQAFSKQTHNIMTVNFMLRTERKIIVDTNILKESPLVDSLKEIEIGLFKASSRVGQTHQGQINFETALVPR